MSFMGFANIVGIFSPQEKINTQSLDGVYSFSEYKAFFNNKPVVIPRYFAKSENLQVLGESNVAKRIEIDLSTQTLRAFEGENAVYSFPVSTGKWNRTPKGVFRIWVKLRYTLMKGGSKALGTYYYLPNVPYTMFFYNEEIPKTDGFGIHGAYWHNNFGHPMSHGCINMREADAEKLFYWASPDAQGKNSVLASQGNQGTEIIIYGDAPQE